MFGRLFADPHQKNVGCARPVGKDESKDILGKGHIRNYSGSTRKEFTDILEQASIDEALLDCTLKKDRRSPKFMP